MDKKEAGCGCGCGGKAKDCQGCAELIKKAEALKLFLSRADHEVKHRVARLILVDAEKNGATEFHRRALIALMDA